jgi:hypothetical protein
MNQNHWFMESLIFAKKLGLQVMSFEAVQILHEQSTQGSHPNHLKHPSNCFYRIYFFSGFCYFALLQAKR